eukprot:m.719344 g.719344  ORF g.719344 m.719344 type:complete len:370 (-) comp22999_c1_seq15:766-1875(-)
MHSALQTARCKFALATPPSVAAPTEDAHRQTTVTALGVCACVGAGGSAHGVVYRRNRRSRVLSQLSESSTRSVFGASAISEEAPQAPDLQSCEETHEAPGTSADSASAMDAATSPTLPDGADVAGDGSALQTESFATVASERDELRLRNEELLEAQRRLLEGSVAGPTRIEGAPDTQQIKATLAGSGRNRADAAVEFADMLTIRERALKQLIWSTTEEAELPLSVHFSKTGTGNGTTAGATPTDEGAGSVATLDRHTGKLTFRGNTVLMDSAVDLEAYFCLKRPTATPTCLFNPYSMRGYLVKRGTFRKNWLHRWFVFSLRTKHLAYYRKSDETQLRGVIPLTNICATAAADSLRGINPSIMPSGAQVG